MICKDCGNSVLPGSLFCQTCGSKVEQEAPKCPRCGADTDIGAGFCSECGARLTAQGEVPQAYSAPPKQPAAKKNGIDWIIGLSAALLAALVLLFVFVFLPLIQGNSQPEPTKAAHKTKAAQATAESTDKATGKSTAAPTVKATLAPTAAPTAAPTENVTAQFVTLKWIMRTSGSNLQDMGLVVGEINKHLNPKLNAAIELTFVPYTDYDQKFTVMLAAGESYDLLYTNGSLTSYKSSCKNGAFTDLSALVDKYGKGITEVLGQTVLRGAKRDGKLFGIPSSDYDNHAFGIVLLKSVLDKYNVSITNIHSLADLEPVFAKIKSDGTGIVPLAALQWASPEMFLNWDYLINTTTPGALRSGSDSVVNQFTSQENVALYKQMRSYNNAGYVGTDSDLFDGKYFAQPFWIYPGMDASLSSSMQFVHVQLTDRVISTDDATNSMQSILSISENSERAMMFLNLLYTDSALVNLIDYGIEGTHYTKVSGNTIKVVDSPRYDPMIISYIGNCSLAYLSQSESAAARTEAEQNARQAVARRSLGFVFDDSQMASIESACLGVVNQYCPGLYSGQGTDSVDSIVAKFDAALKAAGVDTLLAEEQKQYDAWRANVK